jgi:hypothetical protein
VTGPTGPTGATGPSATIPGPGLNFQGAYSGFTTYYDNAYRRDVVYLNSAPTVGYLANNPSKNGLPTWGTPGSSSDWLLFGTYNNTATSLGLVGTQAISSELNFVALPSLGLLQNAAYLSGVSGWQLRGDGDADIQLSPTSGVAGLSQVVGFQIGAPTLAGSMAAGVESTVAFSALGSTHAGRSVNNTFLGTAIKALLGVNVAFTIGGGESITVAPVYRKNAGAWTALPGAPGVTVDTGSPNAAFTSGVSLTGLATTDQLDFALLCTSTGGVSTFGTAQLTLQIFSL